MLAPTSSTRAARSLPDGSPPLPIVTTAYCCCCFWRKTKDKQNEGRSIPAVKVLFFLVSFSKRLERNCRYFEKGQLVGGGKSDSSYHRRSVAVNPVFIVTSPHRPCMRRRLKLSASSKAAFQTRNLHRATHGQFSACCCPCGGSLLRDPSPRCTIRHVGLRHPLARRRAS